MENNAGLLRRILAAVADNLVVMTVLLAVPTIGLLFTDDFTIPAILGVSAMFSTAVLSVLYQAYFLSHYGATIGKMLFGLKVLDQDNEQYIDFKTAFLRVVVGYFFSAQFFGLGFLRIWKHPEKLGWHDELFNTKVIKTRGALLGIIGIVILLVVMGVMLGKIVLSIVNATGGQLPGEPAPMPYMNPQNKDSVTII